MTTSTNEAPALKTEKKNMRHIFKPHKYIVSEIKENLTPSVNTSLNIRQHNQTCYTIIIMPLSNNKKNKAKKSHPPRKPGQMKSHLQEQ